MFSKLLYLQLVITILFTSVRFTSAQADSTLVFGSDTVYYTNTDASVPFINDTIPSDTLQADSLSFEYDVVAKDDEDKPFLEDQVDYTSDDSMAISMDGQRLFLYGNGKVTYTDIELEADYIEFDMANQEVFARGVPDSNNILVGSPVFKQGQETFSSDSLKYNFNSGKGVIYQVSSQQAEGILHSEKTKRTDDGHVHVKGGRYTTCDADHPHFYLALSKAIVIPEDKIITGPSYFVMADIPTPFIVPFGFFPNTTSRSSGILIPRYGEEQRRGFYLRQAGWYQVLGDYADYTIRGDIYSKGSWAIYNDLAYKLKYKFDGSFALDYSVLDNNDDPVFRRSEQFKVTWRHNKLPEANPTSTFSANVNFQSTKYDQENSYNYNDYLNQTRSSSVSYTKRWPGTPFSLSLSSLASQNQSNATTTMSLPTGTFQATRINPFKALNKTNEKKWYEDIGFSYNAKFANKISTPDSMLLKQTTYNNTNFGLSHDIPLFINIKTGRVFNISPSLSYTGRLYNFYTEKNVFEASNGTDSVAADTVWDYKYAHGINPAISFSFNPKIYGMYVNSRPNPNLIAVRHTISPSASFTYTPDVRKIFPNYPNYYDTISYGDDVDQVFSFAERQDPRQEIYSIFERNMYGTPSANGQSGRVSLRLSNTVEGKRLAKDDTTGGTEKFPILESFSLATSYNPFANKINNEYSWGDIGMNASTKVFKDRLSLRSTGGFSIYGYDTTGNRINEFIWNSNDKYFRLTRLDLNAGINFRSKQGEDENNNEENMGMYNDQMMAMQGFMPGAYYGGSYADFDVPWNLSFNYSWGYINSNPYRASRIQTLSVNGELNLTSNWRIGGNTNYDIESREFSFTNIRIYRDLHCWEMNFTLVPFGSRKSYSFTLSAKSTLLRDLKVDKEHHWFDNF